MRSGDSLLLRGLVLTAVADWLVARTLTRGAVYMPKSPPMLAVFQSLGLMGQFAFTLAGVLALLAVGWIAWQMRKDGRVAVSLLLAALLVLSILFVFLPPGDWDSVGYHLLALGAISLVGATAAPDARRRIFPGIALALGHLSQTSAALSNALYLSEPLPLTLLWFSLGEFFVVASGFVLWWTSARGRTRAWMWLIATFAALTFAAIYLIRPSLTAMLALWSLGLTLYLPMPLYATSLLLTVLTLLVWLAQRDRAAMALPLLAAGGYAPQISTGVFLGIVALWLLARAPLAQTSPAPRTSAALPGLARDPIA